MTEAPGHGIEGLQAEERYFETTEKLFTGEPTQKDDGDFTTVTTNVTKKEGRETIHKAESCHDDRQEQNIYDGWNPQEALSSHGTVVLLAGQDRDEQSFYVDAVLLLEESPVFQKILTSGLAETHSRRIRCPQFTCDSVALFLKMLELCHLRRRLANVAWIFADLNISDALLKNVLQIVHYFEAEGVFQSIVQWVQCKPSLERIQAVDQWAQTPVDWGPTVIDCLLSGLVCRYRVSQSGVMTRWKFLLDSESQSKLACFKAATVAKVFARFVHTDHHDHSTCHWSSNARELAYQFT